MPHSWDQPPYPESKTKKIRHWSKTIKGHGAVIDSKVVGSHTLIGMNATLLHGSTIASYHIAIKQDMRLIRQKPLT
jgi:hypothetical protein